MDPGKAPAESLITCRQRETLFLPIFRVVDTRTDDFLDEVLWIGAVHVPSILNCTVGHRIGCKWKNHTSRGFSSPMSTNTIRNSRE